MDYNNSIDIPNEYYERLEKLSAEVFCEVRNLGFNWDSICNFGYKAINDGLYNAEQKEIYHKI